MMVHSPRARRRLHLSVLAGLTTFAACASGPPVMQLDRGVATFNRYVTVHERYEGSPPVDNVIVYVLPSWRAGASGSTELRVLYHYGLNLRGDVNFRAPALELVIDSATTFRTAMTGTEPQFAKNRFFDYAGPDQEMEGHLATATNIRMRFGSCPRGSDPLNDCVETDLPPEAMEAMNRFYRYVVDRRSCEQNSAGRRPGFCERFVPIEAGPIGGPGTVPQGR